MRNFKDNVLRLVAVLGLIVVLLLGAWGIIQLAFWLPSLLGDVTGSIGGIFSRQPAKETISITIPAQSVSGSTVTLAWTNRNSSGTRTYGLAYQCRDGVTLSVALPGKTAQKVACDTPFKLEGATSSVRITPTLAGKTATPVGISIAASDATGAIVATTTGGTTVTAAPAATTTTVKPATTTTKPASTYYPSGRTTNLYGYADLQLSINSAYVAGSNAAIQFTVANVGTNVAPANWFFIANLPINGGYTYQSPTQQALYPGDRVVFTMGYQATGAGSNTYCPPSYYGPGATYVAPCYGSQYGNYGYGAQSVTIHADPYNLIPETNEVNNTASRIF